MWTFTHRGTVLFWIIFTASLVESQQCPDGLYWCQDRCGTDADTCCQTPDGQHNLCGPGTICCGFGCCPDSSFTCNADFSCTGPDGQVIPPAPNPNPSGQPGLTTGVGEPPPMTDDVGSETSSQPDLTDGPTGGVGTETVELPVDTSPTALTTLDQTLTLEPPPNTSLGQLPPTGDGMGTETTAPAQDPETTTLVYPGSTSTLSPSAPPNTSPEPNPETSAVVTDETQSLTLPSVTKETTLTTEAENPTSIPGGDSTTIIPDNDGQPQSPGTTKDETTTTTPAIASDETQTLAPPSVTEETTSTTEGETISPIPGGASTSIVSEDDGQPQPPVTTKQEEPGTSPVVVIDETQTLTLPVADEGTTLTTDGHTVTLTPGGSPTIIIPDDEGQPQSPESTDQGTPESTSDEVVSSGTMTTEEQTATMVPGAEPTTTEESPPTQEPAPTEEPDWTSAPLPTHTEWPSEGVLKPVETEVETPQPSNHDEDDENDDDNDDGDDDDEDDDSAIIPCKLWFFSWCSLLICIKFDNINILGWELNLPPGIYPPGPPPFKNIKFPPSIEVQGDLPPWPEFTVGPDHVPTFPSEPESTQCETKTASLCSATTSYVVSTVNGAEETVSSQVLPPTCGEVRGCLVTDSTQTQEATATKTDECSTATVTDVAVTCSGSGTTACSTTTEDPRTGCSVTATTTTATCTPVQTGEGNVRRQTGDNACPLVETYIVWPRDGTKNDETSAIKTAMEKLLQDESKIRISDTKNLGINFWKVSLDSNQAQKIREIPNVVAVYRKCTSDCPDPLTTVTNWRYQNDYAENESGWIDSGRPQMTYLSYKKNSMTDVFDNHPEYDPKKFINYYNFDVSAGEDVEVYIVDTGATIDHAEFTQGDNVASKTRFMFVDADYDDLNHEDDSGIPLGGHCVSSKEGELKCNPHGTSMLTMVAGAKLGIAKKVKPVVVRLPRRNELGGGATPDDYAAGLSMINNELTGRSEETRAILSLSFYYNYERYKHSSEDPMPEEGFEGYKLRLYQQITSLIEKGVFVVTGSGNDASVKGWPALFGAEPSRVEPERQEDWLYIPELLVVGGAQIPTGERYLQSGISPELDLPHIYAPGKNVLSAQGDKRKWVDDNPETFKESSGTSISTAYTAGLAAYFLKLHQVGRLGPDAKGNEPDMSPAGLRRYILNNGWSRLKDGLGDVVSIWNGADAGLLQLQGVCPYEPPNPELQLRILQRENADPLTGQCVPGTSPTGNPTVEPTTIPSEITTDQTTFQTSTRSPEPTDFACTEETADMCAPALICSAPRRNGCIDGKCVCIIPEPPPPETTTQNPEPTSEPEPEPTSEPEPEPEPTKTPLEVGPQHCNNEDDFPDHKDVNGGDVFWSAMGACEGDSNLMGPGDRWEENFNGRLKESKIHLRVEWVKDCVTDEDRQDMTNPFQDNGESIGENRCTKLFHGNWENCINGGVGGWIDAGCLRYYMGAGHI